MERHAKYSRVAFTERAVPFFMASSSVVREIEKFVCIGKDIFYGRYGMNRCSDRLAEDCSVILGNDAPICYDNHASVTFRAHEASEPLPELDHRLGNHVVSE